MIIECKIQTTDDAENEFAEICESRAFIDLNLIGWWFESSKDTTTLGDKHGSTFAVITKPTFDEFSLLMLNFKKNTPQIKFN